MCLSLSVCRAFLGKGAALYCLQPLPQVTTPCSVCMRVSLQQLEPEHKMDIPYAHSARKWKDLMKIKVHQPLSNLGAGVSLYGTVQGVTVPVYLQEWEHTGVSCGSWEVLGGCVCVSSLRGGTALEPSMPAAVETGQSVWVQLLEGSCLPVVHWCMRMFSVLDFHCAQPEKETGWAVGVILVWWVLGVCVSHLCALPHLCMCLYVHMMSICVSNYTRCRLHWILGIFFFKKFFKYWNRLHRALEKFPYLEGFKRHVDMAFQDMV